MFDLDRFHEAQDSAGDGFADALRELRAGRKTSHWIWYVFPQLRGLGTSPMAVAYGLAGPEEGAAYLEDRVLTARLVDAASAVRAHVGLSQASPALLDTVMGSPIDAQKLVSSMTLFAHLAGRLDVAGRPDLGSPSTPRRSSRPRRLRGTSAARSPRKRSASSRSRVRVCRRARRHAVLLR
jgi:uncharacterized protein (DUF1810 family)